jgi:hypothetical protein
VSSSVPPPGHLPPAGHVTANAPAPAPPHSVRRRRTPSKLIAGGLGLAVAVALAFLLFGSTSTPVADPIAQAATLSSGAPGYRMSLSVAMTSPALQAPITASGDGVVDLRDHAASMSIAIDFSELPQAVQQLGSTTMQMGMIVDGNLIYMKFPQALANAVPSLSGRQWIKINLGKLAGVPGLSSVGNDPTLSDPSHMLQYLRAASDSITNEGRQQVDGVETTHYHADLSVDRLAANVPAAEKDAIEQALSQLRQATQGQDFPTDVWIDAHHLVRRMVISFAFNSPNGPTLQETATADLTDYGPQPRPTPPPSDQVQDLSSLVGAG